MVSYKYWNQRIMKDSLRPSTINMALLLPSCILQERLADTKGVIISRKSEKDRQYEGQKQEVQTKIYKTLHRKRKIVQHEPH